MSADRPTNKKPKSKFDGGRRFDAFEDIPDLTTAQFAVLVYIGSKMHLARPTASSWNLSYEQIAKGARCTERTAMSAVKTLVSRELISCEKRFAGGHQARNKYKILPLAFSSQGETISPCSDEQSETISPMKGDQGEIDDAQGCNYPPFKGETISPVLICSNKSSDIIYSAPQDVDPAPAQTSKRKVDLRSAMAPPRRLVTPLMVKTASAVVFSCFRTAGYFLQAEWEAETKRLLGQYDSAAFETLGAYMIDRGLRGEDGRVASDLELYLKAALAWQANPDSPEAYVTKLKGKGGHMVQHISPKSPGGIVPKSDYWVAHLEKREIPQWYADPKVSAKDKTALKARFADLGGDPEELG